MPKRKQNYKRGKNYPPSFRRPESREGVYRVRKKKVGQTTDSHTQKY